MDWVKLRQSIPALKDQIYLNTGVSGAPPLQSVEEEQRWVRKIGERGPGRPDVMEAAARRVDGVRSSVAALVGAGAHEIALTQSCSDGIALVAAGLPWTEGDEVIVSQLEHISGLIPWFDLQRRAGIKVRTVPLRDGRLHVDDVAGAITSRTKLICLSHVVYTTGARLPVDDVAALARERGVLLLVDGAQGPGHILFDVKRLGCHFYAAPGQKWMLGPDGTGFLYVEEQSLGHVAPTRLGWASVEPDGAAAEQFSFKEGAARYETAGKHTPSLAALGCSVDMLHKIGVGNIEQRILHLVGHVRTGLAGVPGLQFVTPEDENVWSGLLVFTLANNNADDVVDTLWRNHRIVCRTIPRFDAVRISVHAYNTIDELDTVVAAVKEIAVQRRLQ